MNFSQALEELKAGKRLARTGWNGRNMWVAAQFPDAHSKMGLPYLFMCTVAGALVPWLASNPDLFADDWEEVQTPVVAESHHAHGAFYVDDDESEYVDSDDDLAALLERVIPEAEAEGRLEQLEVGPFLEFRMPLYDRDAAHFFDPDTLRSAEFIRETVDERHADECGETTSGGAVFVDEAAALLAFAPFVDETSVDAWPRVVAWAHEHIRLVPPRYCNTVPLEKARRKLQELDG